MNKFLLSLFLIAFSVSCKDFQKQSANSNPNSETESPGILKAKSYSDLNKLVSKLDPNRNPYIIQKDISKLIACDMLKKKERAKCVISQFMHVETPIQVGPYPAPNFGKTNYLTDSIFISVCMKDTNYFQEEERQYSYANGKIIDQTSNYYLFLILEQFGVGVSYELYSISINGDFISHETVGAEGSDSYSIFGIISDGQHFQTETKDFGYDEKNDLMYFKKSTFRKFIIDEIGNFIEED